MIHLTKDMQHFNRINSRIMGLYHELSTKLGVTDTEAQIFYTLLTEGNGCNQNCFYLNTGLTKSTVNSSLHKMQKKGLVELKQGEGRNTRLFLTDKGSELAEKTAGRIIEIENIIFDGWTAKQRIKYLELTQKYFDDLKRQVDML